MSLTYRVGLTLTSVFLLMVSGAPVSMIASYFSLDFYQHNQICLTRGVDQKPV